MRYILEFSSRDHKEYDHNTDLKTYLRRDSETFFKDLQNHIKKPLKKRKPLLSTFCGLDSTIGTPLFLPAMDCDSSSNMGDCYWFLKKRMLNFALIESSENHFWFVINKPSTMMECLKLMDSLPGDSRYKSISKKEKNIVFRAVPKSGFHPYIKEVWKYSSVEQRYFKHTSDMFNESSRGFFKKWMYEFKIYWERFNIEKMFTNLDAPFSRNEEVPESTEFEFLTFDFY